MSGRPLLFYGDWPLGYVNQEAERKARAFAAAGYDVTYVTGAGIRNPRAARVTKLGRHALRAVRERSAPAPDDDLAAASLLVAPPRQRRRVHEANVRWAGRQVRSIVPRWDEAIAWVRHATPELVAALERDRPAAVVYEVVDAHHVGPGMTGIWRTRFEHAERRLVALADRVVVTNPPLAPRFEAWGATVDLAPHGVDLFPWSPPRYDGPVVLGFLGVLDGRLDRDVLAHVARARPAWQVRLVGPVEAGFDPAALAGLPNVAVEPPVPHARIGEVLAGFTIGLLAYGDFPQYAGMSPLKLLELFAAGRAVVVRPTPSIAPLADLLRFATTGEEFVAQVEHVLATDTVADARARRAVAESRSWTTTIDGLLALLEETVSDAAAP